MKMSRIFRRLCRHPCNLKVPYMQDLLWHVVMFVNHCSCDEVI